MNLFEIHRRSKGLTQQKLAKLVGVKPSTVCMWETRNTVPDAERIPKLAEILGLDPLKLSEFFAENGKEKEAVPTHAS